MRGNNLFINATIIFFISISNLSPDRYDIVFDHCREMIGAVNESAGVPVMELWEQSTSEQLVTETTMVKAGTNKNTDIEIKNGLYQIYVNAMYPSSPDNFMYYAKLRSRNEAENGLTAENSTIRIEIPQRIMKGDEIEKLMPVFIEYCAKMGADYACVDVSLLSQLSMEQGPFRMFQTDDVKNNEKLPGIHWGQYISKQKYESIDDIIVSARENQNICIVHEDNGFIWIQLDEKLGQPSIKTRNLFWYYFKEALPEIDFNKVESYKVPIFKDMIPYWIPSGK